MIIELEKFTNGPFHENCYILGNDQSAAIIIDPGGGEDEIIDIVDLKRWTPLAIINTHAHYDHVGAIDRLMKHFNVPFFMHGKDAKLLKHANTYGFLFASKKNIKIPQITNDLSNCEPVLKLGNFDIKWLFTPGHTEGSVCFIIGEYIFTGDTLFADGVGRTDLPGGDQNILFQSLQRLNDLDQSLILCPGHGSLGNLGHALGNVHFLRKTY